MSSMIQCDECKKLMYADSRSDKFKYIRIRIDDSYGHLTTIHLCELCISKYFMKSGVEEGEGADGEG